MERCTETKVNTRESFYFQICYLFSYPDLKACATQDELLCGSLRTRFVIRFSQAFSQARFDEITSRFTLFLQFPL